MFYKIVDIGSLIIKKSFNNSEINIQYAEYKYVICIINFKRLLINLL